MDIPKKEIKSRGKPYFDEGFIQEFIDIIESMAPKPEKYFFQLTQKENKPTLEFGCKAGPILFDATATLETKDTCVSLFSAAKIIILRQSINSTQLHILSSANAVIFRYTAVTDEARKDLREYAEFLQKKKGLSDK